MVTFRIEFNPKISVLAQCRDDYGRPIVSGSRLRRLLFQQFNESAQVVAIFSHDDLVMVLGVYDAGAHHELWFWGGPAIKQSPRESVRLARKLVGWFLRSYKTVLSLVRTDQDSGAKLARLVGMVATGETGSNAGFPYEVYKCQDC